MKNLKQTKLRDNLREIVYEAQTDNLATEKYIDKLETLIAEEVREILNRVEKKKPWVITPGMPEEEYKLKWHGTDSKYWWDRFRVFIEQELDNQAGE